MQRSVGLSAMTWLNTLNISVNHRLLELGLNILLLSNVLTSCYAFVTLETGMNTPQSNVIFLLNSLMTS